MLTTKNFRIIGAITAPGSFTVELGGTIVFNGPAQNTVIGNYTYIANGTSTFEPVPSPLLGPPGTAVHTVLPCVITVNSGNLDIGLWEWDPVTVLNPNLPQQCLDYYNEWEPLPDDAPFAPSEEINNAALAAGGWRVFPASAAWWTGGKKHAPVTRFNMLLNGTPITIFDENYYGIWNVTGLVAGDVLSYDLAIPNQ